MTIDPSALEAVVRSTLNLTAPRTMVVLEPLKVRIVNAPKAGQLSVPNFPDAPEKGEHKISPVSNVIYIEKTDFKEAGEKGYRRLTSDQAVGLRYAGFVLKLVKVLAKGKDGQATEIEAECTPVDQAATKPKAFIHWVSGDSTEVEVRLYERLFKHKNPEDPAVVPDGFLSDVNLDSLKVLAARADNYLLKSAKVYDKFQFERMGFFSVDTDTTAKKLVFNRTVSLKEDAGK